MRKINSPRWTGNYDVEVCNRCRIFWVDEDQYPNIPNAEDMLVEEGDTTIIADMMEQKIALEVAKDKKQSMEFLTGPHELHKKIAGFFGLPVEIHNRDDPFGIIGKVIALIILGIYIWQDNSQVFQQLGFYPEDLFRNSGLNLVTAPFLHGSLGHLIGNLYFFLVFANDVENHLSPVKFVLFLFGTIFLESLTNRLTRVVKKSHLTS